MKLFIIQCYLYSFHARSRNFAWHLLWLSTTEGTNIVKLLGQLFSTFKFPSNFWKIAPLLGKITNAESLRFLSLSFPSKKSSFMAMNSLWSGGKTFTPCASKTNIRRENWELFNYRIYPRMGRTPNFQWFSREKKMVRSSTGINKPNFEINNS